MIPSRYSVINERSPYPVKRKIKGRTSEETSEPAISLLSSDSYLIMEGPNFNRQTSPRVFRTVAPKSAKNKEASSFVILGDTIRSPVLSRSGSPSGRISPFRGHGFKSPTTTRPNSRATSPTSSPMKTTSAKTKKSIKTDYESKERFNKDIGLPPKSPRKIGKNQPLALSNFPTTKPILIPAKNNIKEGGDIVDNVNKTEELIVKIEENTENLITDNEITKETKDSKDIAETEKDLKGSETDKILAGTNDIQTKEKEISKEQEVEAKVESTAEENKDKNKKYGFILLPMEPEEVQKNVPKPREKLMPVDLSRRDDVKKRLPISPTPRNKTKIDKNVSNLQQKQTSVKKMSKPPIPPRRIGLKSTLKTDEIGGDDKKSGKNKVGVKGKEKPANETSDNKKTREIDTMANQEKTDKEKPKEEVKILKKGNSKPFFEPPQMINLGGASPIETKKILETKEPQEKKKEEELKKNEESKKDEKADRLVPCLQPDKCQIAPPTMASPSPIITPSISTPSTSADLAPSMVKSSQSISTAPTTVTPSSMSSLSSAVVLGGNLARKEISKSRGPIVVENAKVNRPDTVVTKEIGSAGGSDTVTTQMVRAGTKDSIKEKQGLEEITSTGKVVRSKPEVEVLSPNNLRNSPPRMPPPNMAWDEERWPNGDVPAKEPKQGKIRRFFSALCKFFSLIFCCGCCKCCKKSNSPQKPSIFSKLCCCKGSSCKCSKCCGNLFKCCKCKCNKPKCCEGSKCCGGKSKPKKKNKGNCCAKPCCSCRNCCNGIKTCCSNMGDKINGCCRTLFCLNLTCCQSLLKKCNCCHSLKCCQANGCCSCCNPFVKKESKKLSKTTSHISNASKENQVDPVLVEHTSKMKAAIPVLPSPLAIFCLTCNLFVPGLGTFISGLLCLCFGKPRFSTKDSPKNRVKSFIINTIIGVAQLFTVIFCLVGWGWSIWWGIIMYKLSKKQKRLDLVEKSQKEAENSIVNQNRADVEQG